MPIASFKPDRPKDPVTPKDDVVTTQDIVSTSDPAFNQLVRYVEGSRWKVDYFHQNVTKDQILEDYDPKLPDVLQTFTLIKDMVLQVQDPLDPSPIANINNPSIIQGSSIYFATITPYKGDLFVATLPDNTLAIFTVNNVERKTYFRQSVYQITYTLSYLLTSENDTVYKDIVEKTTRSYIFDEDQFHRNLSPLLTVSDFETKKQLHNHYLDIIDYMMSYLVDKTTWLISIPHPDYDVYDPYLVSYFFELVDISSHWMLKQVRRIDLKHTIRSHPFVYRAMIEQDEKILDYCYREVVIYPSRYAGDLAETRSIYHLGMDYIVLPKNYDTLPRINLVSSIDYVDVPNPNHKNPDVINGIDVIDQIPQISGLSTYLFSQDFYDRVSGLKLIESMVLQLIRNEPLDSSLLLGLCENSYRWGRLEQVYYMPVLLHLIRHQLNHMKSNI